MSQSCDAPIIAVLGCTGAGKSSFIHGITGSQHAKVGHSLRSETKTITLHLLQTRTAKIQLADTPGFDDTELTDFEVLEKLAKWMEETSKSGLKLSGIVYLHPVHQTRFQGSSRRMIRTMEKLLGKEWFGRVLLVTSFWNMVSQSIAEAREQELIDMDVGWKPFIAGGALVERMAEDYGRFVDILEDMADVSNARTQLEKELAAGIALTQTMAALTLRDENLKEATSLSSPGKEVKISSNRSIAHESNLEKITSTVVLKEQVEKLQEEETAMREELKNRDKLHQNELRSHKARLEAEEQKRKQVQEKMRREREEAEHKMVITELEQASRIRYRASVSQRTEVDTMIEAIRILAKRGLPQRITGVQADGYGMGPVQGHLTMTFSVHRTGLNSWCDYCRCPLSAKAVYTCLNCVFKLCDVCHKLGRGCLDRSHILVESRSLTTPGDEMSARFNHPEQQLWCWGRGCNQMITGLYLYTNCQGYELNFCGICIQARGFGCNCRTHVFQVGVRPTHSTNVSRFESTTTDGTKYAQKISRWPAVWMDSRSHMLPIGFSVIRFKEVEMEQTLIQSAKDAGILSAQITSNWSWCDFCHKVPGADSYYCCNNDHPEAGIPNFNLLICKNCYARGIRCPSNHPLTFYNYLQSSCRRYVNPPTGIMCDSCRVLVKHTCFHCCSLLNDDFDMCLQCVLNGLYRGKENNDYPLQMLVCSVS